MNWFNGLPTKPGWYWLRLASKPHQDEIVRLHINEGKLVLGGTPLECWASMEQADWSEIKVFGKSK